MSHNDPRQTTAPNFKRRSANSAILHATSDWEVWNCEGPEYRHHYDRDVSLCVNKGSAIVSFSDGRSVDLKPGDLLTITKGVSATWQILEPIENRYVYHDSLPQNATLPCDL